MSKAFNKFYYEQKSRDVKRMIESKYRSAKCWVVDNKDFIIFVAAPVVVTGLTAVVKVVGKNINLRKQESVKNLYCYDRSLGHYWKLGRELSNNEWLEVDRRKMNGERLADILSDMKVLK